MKRLIFAVLILAMVLLSAGICAAEGTVVKPFPAETEVDTSYGVYYVTMPDPSTIGNGYIDCTLYSQDLYSLSDIEGLKPGSRLQIEEAEYTVSSVAKKDDGSIEIVPEGSYTSYIFRAYGETCVAENKYARPVATRVADYKIMMPLPYAFRYCRIGSDGKIKDYDADHFAEMMTSYSFTFDRAYTVLSFSGGLPDKLIWSVSTVQNAVEAVRAANIQTNTTVTANTGNTAGKTAANASSFKLTPVVWDGVGLGKCGVPAGYTMTSEVHCADDSTCLGAPIRVRILAESGSIPATLGFYSCEMFVERIKSAYFKHKEGTRDPELNIFMRQYRDAAGYCDDLASRLAPGARYYKDEDISFYNATLEKHRNEYKNELEAGLAQSGVKLNWYDITAAHRVYTYDNDGTTFALCVMAEVRAFQNATPWDVATFWAVPEYYYMVCPLSSYERIHATDFQAFIENTAVSDTFIQLADILDAKIQQEITAGWAAAIRASNAYASAMNALMTQSVNDYLYSSSYSSADRFSDYIFDRYEYTTSDGYSVSISTSYDYVWENGGTVYYSTSAFDVPTNATLLTPTR